MKWRGFRNIVVIFLLMVSYSQIVAQVRIRASVNRDKILIGEPISLTVEAYMPLGVEYNWFRADSIPAFVVTESSSIDTAETIDGKQISQTLVVTSFDSGRQYVPPFEVLVNGQPYYTDSIPVEVSFAPFDPNADYRDIKDIIEVVNPSVKYVPWVIAAIAALSLAALIYLMTRKKRIRVISPPTPQPLLTPYEEAMKSLRTLAGRSVEPGEAKYYYSELNDIFRNYLYREFGISTFERTNEELIIHLSKLDMEKDAYIRLTQSLRMSDFVKFAKYHPSESDNERNLSTVKQSIDILNKTVISAV